jgi:hypothetical protein
VDRLKLVLVAALLASPAAAQQCGMLTTCPPVSTPLAGTELLYVVQGGVSKKMTTAQLGAAISPLVPIAPGQLRINPSTNGGVLWDNNGVLGDSTTLPSGLNLQTPSAINLENATNLPAPTLTTLGGVEAINAVSHQWIAYIDTSGVPHLAQPALGDISGLGTNVATALGNAAGATGGFATYSQLGSAAFDATGTTGGTVPLNNGGFTQSGAAIFSSTFVESNTALASVVAGQLGLAGGNTSNPSLGANDEGDVYLQTVNGLVLIGNGSTYDVSLLDRAGNVALGVATGTVNLVAGGTISTTGVIASPPTSAFAQAWNSSQTVSASSASSVVLNQFTSTDSAAVGSNFVNDILFNTNFGGSTASGGRQVVEVIGELTTATSASNANRNYVGIYSAMVAGASDGGSTGNYEGAFIGANFDATALNGATYLFTAYGAEFNTNLVSGSSVAYKALAAFSSTTADVVNGSTVNAMLYLYNQSGATAAWSYGALFDGSNRQWPFSNTATIIATLGSGSAANGIDFSPTTFSGCAFKSVNVCIDGSGNIVTSGKIESTGNYFLLTFNAGATYPPALGTSFALGTNFTNASAEVDFWNADASGPGVAFNFYQLTGASSSNLLVSISPSGKISAGNASLSGVGLSLQNSVGTCTFTATSSGSSTQSCSSDRRLKTDIRDAGDELAWLNSFGIRDYAVIANGEPGTSPIAQEVALIHPEMVSEGVNGFLQLQAPSPWKMMRVMQELVANDNDRDARIVELRREIDALIRQEQNDRTPAGGASPSLRGSFHSATNTLER